MSQERDRLSLSRDIEVIADRIAQDGQAARADELKVVAARLRAKDEAQRRAARAAHPSVADPPRAYVLGIALVLSWLAVVLLAVVLLVVVLEG